MEGLGFVKPLSVHGWSCSPSRAPSRWRAHHAVEQHHDIDGDHGSADEQRRDDQHIEHRAKGAQRVVDSRARVPRYGQKIRSSGARKSRKPSHGFIGHTYLYRSGAGANKIASLSGT